MADPFVGEIRMFAGNFAPQGWALCDGQLLAVAQTLGQSEGCTLLLQREAVIFSGNDVIDLTAKLSEAYNKQG